MCDWGWGPEECAVNLVPMHGVERYSPADDTWTELAPLPVGRFRCAGASAEGFRANSEGALFLFGGHEHNETAVQSMWSFHLVQQPALYVHTPA